MFAFVPYSAKLRRVPLAALFYLLALVQQAALGAEPKLTVQVEKPGAAFVVDASLDVPVPVETAWDVLTDFDHMTAFLTNLTLSKVASRNGHTLVIRQQGVAKYGLLALSFVSEREIRLEPMKRVVARGLSGTMKRMDSETDIVPLAQGALIKYHAELEPDSLLARVFGKSFVRHEVKEQFTALGNEMLRRYASAANADRH